MKKYWYILMTSIALSCLFIVGCDKVKHEHVYQDAWCTDENSHWQVCTTCGEKQGITLHNGGTATCTEKAVCQTCGAAYGDVAAHTYDVENYDETYHWKECSCGKIEETKTAHTGGEATCTEKAICDGCGEAYGETLAHEYTIDNYDETYHWKECVCGAVDEETKALHYDNDTSCQEQQTCESCGVVFGDYGAHEYTVLNNNDTYHWYSCECGEISNDGNVLHCGGVATCEELAICEVCETPYGEKEDHVYTVDGKDDTTHWKECACGEVDQNSVSTHEGGEATCLVKAVCDVCGVTYGEFGEHSGGVATCENQAVCDICSLPYGALGNHVYDVDGGDGEYTWKECVCGEIDESTKEEIVNTGGTDGGNGDNTGEGDNEDGGEVQPPEEEIEYAQLYGAGTVDDPYVLTGTCNVKLTANSLDAYIYFAYETQADGVLAFTDTKNVDGNTFEIGTNKYVMEGIDATHIEVEMWKTYYIRCKVNTVGEFTFAFVVE